MKIDQRYVIMVLSHGKVYMKSNYSKNIDNNDRKKEINDALDVLLGINSGNIQTCNPIEKHICNTNNSNFIYFYKK
jgi:hypothetical protein